MTDIYTTYWIHLPEHTDIFSQGYVGITKKEVGQRFKEHLSNSKRPDQSHKLISKALVKYGEKVCIEAICISDKDYAKDLEKKLRPQNFIGWNMTIGGMTPPELSPEKKKLATEKRSITMEGRYPSGENHPNWKGGIPYKSAPKPWTPEKRKAVAIKVSEKLKDKPLTEGHKEKLSLRKKEFFEEFGPWANSQANKEIWIRAEEIYNKWVSEPCGDRKLSRELGLPRNTSVKNMIVLFASGWVPTEDERFVRFLSNEA